ncbi:response regulator [Shewanella maritima]|uniref:Response regulator n=1 Tax=Shewanella maritima TaxID=2520507 RepID=A0A411PGV8_9GAMM|nr:response regulator [Shewanella maritima]QBF82694.1 response regulator [Shewanella maritima]
MDQAKILIIDDDPVCAGLLLAILGDDYLVMSANSGEGAIEILNSMTPDLIFLDIAMPNINGYQVIKHIQQTTDTPPPVVVISSLAEASDKEFALKLGANGYLTKPIVPNEIQGILSHYL